MRQEAARPQRLIGVIRNHPAVAGRPTVRQFVKFVIVGFTNTVLDFGIYVALTRLSEFWREHYLWANVIAFSIAVVNSYIWNRRWTFRNTQRAIHIQFAKFALVSIVGLGLNEAVLALLVSAAGFYDIAAKAAAVAVVTVWNFAANRFWTFSVPGQSPPPPGRGTSRGAPHLN